MNRAPAFQFYPDKWLAHTRHLSDMACRVYHDLLCWIWQHSPDQHTIRKDGIYVAIARPREEVDRAMSEVQQPAFRLLKERGEKYISDGLRKEVKKQKIWRQKSASGGRRSASTRKANKLDANHPSTTLEPKGVPNGNTPSPSSSPSPSPKSTTTTPAAAGPYADILNACPPEYRPTDKDVTAWAHQRGLPVREHIDAIAATVRAEPPHRWSKYAARLVEFAINNAADKHAREKPRQQGGLFRGPPIDGPSEEWTRAYADIADQIWRAKESGEGGDAIRRAMQKARDAYNDVPRHKGKHVVDAAIEMAMNNRRPE